jgi:NADH-quinone oxidoreductase subunit K
MITVMHYVFFSTVLFSLGLVGVVINRGNLILILVCIELMLLGVNTNFIAFSHYLNTIAGQVFVFFILTVAAAEAAIGLAIVLLFYRNRGNIDVLEMNHLKG